MSTLHHDNRGFNKKQEPKNELNANFVHQIMTIKLILYIRFVKKNLFAKCMLFTNVQIVTDPNKYFFILGDEFYFIF
jgi:hypothetical protein